MYSLSLGSYGRKDYGIFQAVFGEEPLLFLERVLEIFSVVETFKNVYAWLRGLVA